MADIRADGAFVRGLIWADGAKQGSLVNAKGIFLSSQCGIISLRPFLVWSFSWRKSQTAPFFLWASAGTMAYFGKFLPETIRRCRL